MSETLMMHDSRDASLQTQVETMRAMFGSPAADGLRREGESSRDPAGPRPRIAIIDDQSINIKIVQKYLKQAGYEQFFSTTDAREAMTLIGQERPDVVLLDIMMPHVSGLDILRELRGSEEYADLPVIVLTATSDQQTKLDAWRLGASEFLLKPVDPAELQLRLRNVLTVKAHQDGLKQRTWELEKEVAVRSAALAEAHREIVECLATVGEYRDNDTGRHIVRVGRYAEIIAHHLGIAPEFAERLRLAAPLHDIGKVGIPDAILLKPGKLDHAEFSRMQHHCKYGKDICEHHASGASSGPTHTQIGRSIVGRCSSPILQMAASVAYTHHERWDGSGYPCGLRGAAIPLEGRITALADVFDALTSNRPYKPAFSLEKSLEIIRQQRGSQFDPDVVDAFFAGLERTISVFHECNDASPEEETRAAADPSTAVDREPTREA